MNIALLFQGLASLSWFAFIAVLGVVVMRASRKQPTKGLVSLSIGVLVFALVISIISAGIVFIEPNERAVVVSPYAFRAPGGYLEEALTPGLRWIVPGENARIYSISRQTYTMSAGTSEGQLSGDDSIRARTKDGQEVFIDASVIYQVDPAKVINLHIDWQSRYQDELVRPTTRGIIRDVASRYGIEEIVSTDLSCVTFTLAQNMPLLLNKSKLLNSRRNKPNSWSNLKSRKQNKLVKLHRDRRMPQLLRQKVKRMRVSSKPKLNPPRWNSSIAQLKVSLIC